MSSIAIKWVSETIVGNQTAKQLLLFLATHNFHKPGIFFKLETIAKQMEVTVRSVQKAFKILQDKNLVTKQSRFDAETSRQTTNAYYLNIPDSFVDKYFGEGELGSSLGVNYVQGGEELRSGGVREKRSNSHEYSTGYREPAIPNSNINNKINNNTYRRKQRATKTTKIPSNFVPSEKHLQLSTELGLDVQKESDKFIDHYKATGKSMTDWNACFRNWLRKAKDFSINVRGKRANNNFDEVMGEIEKGHGRTFDESGCRVYGTI